MGKKRKKKKSLFKDRITVHLASKDRPQEVTLFLQSLRTQTHQNWDIIILDDGSGTPLHHNFCFQRIVEQIKLEGHRVKVMRNEFSYKVCAARNKIIDNDNFGNPYVFRGDDDTILEPDVFERLLIVIKGGYDLASGIIPNMGQPLIKRETKHVKPIISEIKLNEEGEPVYIGDDCGFGYYEDEVIPIHHFRTYFLYKSEIQKKIRYEAGISQTGYREEAFFSIRCILEGYKLGVDTGCIIWHVRSPSGGARDGEYRRKTMANEYKFKLWCKRLYAKHGDFMEKYTKEVAK